jgi:hypothetical protein
LMLLSVAWLMRTTVGQDDQPDERGADGNHTDGGERHSGACAIHHDPFAMVIFVSPMLVREAHKHAASARRAARQLRAHYA